MSDDKNKIYRKKSLEKATSPEDLNKYIRIISPSTWLFLIGILVLLLGICIWGIFGQLETKVHTIATVENDEVYCYVNKKNASRIEPGMPVKLNNKDLMVIRVSTEPVSAVSVLDEDEMDTIGVSMDEWVYVVQAEVSDSGETSLTVKRMKSGRYEADILIESIHPMSFLLN